MHHQQEKNYRVRVGHAEVNVRAASVDGAIAAARLKLAADFPRFYDLIRSLEPARFDVGEAA